MMDLNNDVQRDLTHSEHILYTWNYYSL